MYSRRHPHPIQRLTYSAWHMYPPGHYTLVYIRVTVYTVVHCLELCATTWVYMDDGLFNEPSRRFVYRFRITFTVEFIATHVHYNNFESWFLQVLNCNLIFYSVSRYVN